MVIGAMTIGLGTAHAEPAPAAPQPLSYSVKLVDKVVVASLKGGTFSLTEEEGATPEDPKTTLVDIKDDKGATVISMPLEYNIEGTDIPVKPELKKDNTVLEITPEKPANFSISQPLAIKPAVSAKPIASAVENQRAQNDFASKFGIGTAIGGFVGTALGAVIGCVATLPLGCLPGLVTGAGVGGILGTIAVGGPTLAAAGIELINVMQAPEGTSQWADKPKPADAPK
ncbi:hypothetical protein [Nocardia australiensis]|uniref:hypothetical protein n=1 Tax=Nocardia australiensis TaxID=2887191 RepID=UPI001D1390B8|nr:hypothetical protein [Nocardia australiensis]